MEEVVLYSKKEKLNTRDTKPLEKGGYILVMSTRNTLIPMQLYTVKIGNLNKNIEDVKRLVIEGDKKENSESFPLDASHLNSNNLLQSRPRGSF
jgi:hypothetical protein